MFENLHKKVYENSCQVLEEVRSGSKRPQEAISELSSLQERVLSGFDFLSEQAGKKAEHPMHEYVRKEYQMLLAEVKASAGDIEQTKQIIELEEVYEKCGLR